MAEGFRVGVAGLGTAGRQILPLLRAMPGVELTAVTDVRPEALDAARAQYPGIAAFGTVEDLAKSSQVDAVWIATPNEFHAAHAITAAQNGKHIIGEKPMAPSIAECDAMVAAIEASGVKYVQGHSKLHGTVIRQMGSLIASGEMGQVIHVSSWNSNDWLRRPRLESELDASKGGGIVYRQGPHQVDIVRFFGGGLVSSVVGRVGRRAAWRGGDGDYSAFLDFVNGASASLSLNGYGDFDAAELTWNIGEGGRPKVPAEERQASPVPQGFVSADEKYSWADGVEPHRLAPREYQPFFGLTIVVCEHGVVRQSREGIYVYRDGTRSEVRADASIGRRAEIRELQRSLAEGRAPFPGARWGRATVAVCLAILESSRSGAPVVPQAQVDLPGRVALHREEENLTNERLLEGTAQA